MINIDYQEKIINNRIKKSKDGRLPFDYGMICGVITECERLCDTLILKGYAVGAEKKIICTMNHNDKRLPYVYSKKYNIISLRNPYYIRDGRYDYYY